MTNMRASAGWAYRAYGVDLTGAVAIVVCARRAGRGVQVTPVQVDAAHPLPVGRRDAVATAMPPRESLAMWVRAPFASLRKARRVFPTLLDIQLPFPLDDCLYRFLGAARVGQGDTAAVEALGVVVRRSDLDHRLASLSALGIDPHVVDLAGLALWDGSLEAVPPSATESDRVVVCLAGDATVVAGRSGRYGGVQSIADADPAAIDRFLLAQLGSDWRSRASQGSTVRWIWCGSGAANGGAVESLQTALALPAAVAVTTPDDPARFLARALAVRALQSGALRCNLRAGEREHPAVIRRMTKRRLMVATMILAAGLLLIGAAFVAQRVAGRRLAVLQRAVRERASAVVGYPVVARGEDAEQVVARAVERQMTALRPFRAMFAPSLLETLIDAVRGVGAAGCAIQTLTLSHAELELTVHAASDEALDDAVRKLNAAGCSVRRTGAPRVVEGGVTQALTRHMAGEAAR
jgi:hypothetical protein